MIRKLAILALTTFGTVLIGTGLAQAAGTVAEGKALFIKTNCNSCHGMEGKGNGPVAAALDPKPRDFTVGAFKFDANHSGKPGDDEDLQMVIKQGAAAFGGSAMMMPNPGLSDEDIKTIIVYLRSLKQS